MQCPDTLKTSSAPVVPGLRVLKFGGTSVATAQRRGEVARIVRRAADSGPVAVVCSALAGVTDHLDQALADAIAGRPPAHLADQLRERHLEGFSGCDDTESSAHRNSVRRQILDQLVELEALCRGIAALGECPPGARHRVLAAGERLAVPLVTAALHEAGVDAVALDAAQLLVAENFENEPCLDLEASRRQTRARWAEVVGSRQVAVVPGFVAGDSGGSCVTLGRGASDLTATLLASCLDATAVEIWSDVDGILSAPPAWVPSAAPLPALSYGDAAALARFGARVLHPEALAPAAQAGIPVWIRNTLRPQAPGTRIDDTVPVGSIRALSAIRPAVWLTIRAPWWARDTSARVHALLAAHSVRPLVVVGGDGGRELAFCLRQGVDGLASHLRCALGTEAEVEIREDVAAIMALGVSMTETTRALGAAGVSNIATAGGEGLGGLAVAVVEATDTQAGIEAVYPMLGVERLVRAA